MNMVVRILWPKARFSIIWKFSYLLITYKFLKCLANSFILKLSWSNIIEPFLIGITHSIKLQYLTLLVGENRKKRHEAHSSWSSARISREIEVEAFHVVIQWKNQWPQALRCWHSLLIALQTMHVEKIH